MQHCAQCLAFIKNNKLASKIDLSQSFVKIDGMLHLGFSRPDVCPILSTYVPHTIILAGNGAIEVAGGGNCWDVLKNKMEEEGLLGDDKYQDGEVVLTWLAAHFNYFNKTKNSNSALQRIMDKKTSIIKSLQPYGTSPKEIYCHACTKYHVVPVSENILILTTNWDLGLFKKFPNVIQLHGRCDYPEQVILPSHDISLLIAQSIADLERLNCGILPGPFLQRCLDTTKNFIFWGIGLNDYDSALWHFINGFLSRGHRVEVSIAARNGTESFEKAQKKVRRYFPSLKPKNCLCSMLLKE